MRDFPRAAEVEMLFFAAGRRRRCRAVGGRTSLPDGTLPMVSRVADFDALNRLAAGTKKLGYHLRAASGRDVCDFVFAAEERRDQRGQGGRYPPAP